MAEITPETRQQARQVLVDVAKTIDKKLTIEVREINGQPRLQVLLARGRGKHSIELAVDPILAATDDSVARHELRLRLKRAFDTMSFKPMPDHRLSVKPIKSVPPPGGQFGRGQGRR